LIDTPKPSSFVGFIPVVFSNTATDYEAMVYLHTASLATPFSESWYNIYMYLLSKYYPQQAKRIGVYREKLTEVERGS